jgi:hypothetical protein
VESVKETQQHDLVIDVDGQIASLIEEINAVPAASTIDFSASLSAVVIDAVMGPFGLSASMFADRDGGNITTDHNFKKGIVASDSDAARFDAWQVAQKDPFDRAGANAAQNYDHQLKAERKPLFQKTEQIVDAYTGRELPKDGRAHRDHVVPAAQVERSSKAHLGMSREERVRLANDDANLVWTEAGLNQSAGMHDKLEWADKTKRRDGVEVSNAEYFGVDNERLEAAHARAHRRIDSAENLAVLKKQAGEFATQGGKEAGKQALRQVIGIILKELASGLIEDVKLIVRDGFQSIEQLASLLRARLLALAEQIKAKWTAYLTEGVSAGLAGLMSNLVTLLINSFLTTAKRVVTIIRECTLAVVRSVKLIVAPPAGMSGQEIVIEVLKLLSGGIVTAATLLLQESVAKALESFPLFAPFAQDIATVLVAILSGTMGLLTVLCFDRLKSHIAFRNKELADVHRGQAVAFLKVVQTRAMIDQAASHMSTTTAQLELRLTESWAVVEEESSKADAAISDYGSSIERLRTLAKEHA